MSKRKKVLSILLVVAILGSIVPIVAALPTNACDTGQQPPVEEPRDCTYVTPAIKLTKSGPASAKAGTTITYTFTVSNTGQTALSNVTVTDPLLGMTKSLGNMLKGCAPITFTQTYTIPAGATGSVKNTATAKGTYSCKTVSSTACWTVTIPYETPELIPGISLTKSGPVQVNEGGTINYTLVVKNTGTAPLTDVTVTDPMLGGVIYGPASLAVGQSATITKAYKLASGEGIPNGVDNTATAKGKYDCKEVNATASWHVNVIKEECKVPNISLSKTGPVQVNEGGTITYTLVVKNTGTAPLTDVTVTDPMLGGVIYGPASLTVGQSATITEDYKLAAGEGIPDGIDNTATAKGKYDCKEVNATASWHVNVIKEEVKNPKISIEKSGTPDPVMAGGTITYTLVVKNDGDVELSDVIVKDAKLGIDQNLGTMAVGETKTINGSYKTGLQEASVYNKATVEGTYQTTKVTDWDDLTICVIKPKPSIDIIKGGPASANVGEEVTYNFTVTNNGEVDLTDVVVTDARIGLTKNLGSLAKGESKSFTSNYTVLASDGTLIVNTATATGTSIYGPVSDNDSHEMTIKKPAIDIEKSGPPNALVGNTITYTFVVTNTGNVTLNNVVVTDAKLGITKSLGTMAAGASTSFTATYVVQSSDTGELLNTATVTGDSPSGQVEDKDVHKVVINSPGMEFTKTGPETAHVGDKITYTFTVKNTGTVPFFAVSVHDPMLDWYVVDYNIMMPGGSMSWNVDYVIEEDTPDPLYNTAKAAGCTLFYGQVDGQDDHVVDILHPDVDIEKNGPEIGCRGQNITYEFTVINTGDVELTNLVVTDDIVGDIGTIESLAAGASTTLTKDYTIKADDKDPLVNTATVTTVYKYNRTSSPATPVEITLTASDFHVLDIKAASVEIEKTGESEAYVGDEVEYEFKVTNTGEVTLSNLIVTDDVLGDIGTIESLDPGAFETLTAKHIVTATDKDPLVNVATVIGKTPCGLDVTDSDDHSLDIRIRQEVKIGLIEVEKIVNDSDETVTLGDNVSYTLKVTNTGATVIPAEVQLTDSYDTDYLTYKSSDPTSVDNNDDGEITWADVSGGKGLALGESVSVTVNFVAKKTGETDNIAIVTAIDEKENELKDEDEASVSIEARKLKAPTPTPTPAPTITAAPTTQKAATTTAATLPYTGDNLSILIMMAVLMMTTGPLVILTDKIRKRRSGK